MAAGAGRSCCYICKGPAPCPSECPGTLSQDKQILLRAVMLAGAALCRP